jgi:hypothetical protein
MTDMTKKTEKEVKALSLKMSQVTRTDSVFNADQVQKIFNTTPAKFKYSRPAKGGGNWTYIRASYVRKVLDGLFGFNWSFDVETSLAEAFETAKVTKVCVVKGVLTGRVKHDGEMVSITKTQFGRSEVKFKQNTDQPLDFGNDMKAATSDALKKCASLFGIGADVYEPDEFMEIAIEGAQDNTAQADNLKDMTEKAKQAIKDQS